MPIRILLLWTKDIRSYFTYKATALIILNASPHLFFLTSFPGSDNHFHNNALKIYLLFEGENYRESIRHKEILHPLIHFADGHNGQSGQAEARCFLKVSHMGSRVPNLWAILFCFIQATSRKLGLWPLCHNARAQNNFKPKYICTEK